MEISKNISNIFVLVNKKEKKCEANYISTPASTESGLFVWSFIRMVIKSKGTVRKSNPDCVKSVKQKN